MEFNKEHMENKLGTPLSNKSIIENMQSNKIPKLKKIQVPLLPLLSRGWFKSLFLSNFFFFWILVFPSCSQNVLMTLKKVPKVFSTYSQKQQYKSTQRNKQLITNGFHPHAPYLGFFPTQRNNVRKSQHIYVKAI